MLTHTYTPDFALEFGYDLRSVLKGEITASFLPEVAIVKAKDGGIRLSWFYEPAACVRLSAAEAESYSEELISALA
jgi:hypothetical protein